MTTPVIRPMPLKFGVGFVAESPLPEEAARGYRYEQSGWYHNYHYTPQNWRWPTTPDDAHTGVRVIDGFSPNLNKQLHVGHLRNLAVAASLERILSGKAQFVALLGASQGVRSVALANWELWTGFVGYWPDVYYDVLQPLDVVETRPLDGEAETQARVWDGPEGPVMVVRSDGRPLYAYYDLCFAKTVGPTHYITGEEQRGHFKSLGMGEKHLPMGLVLGADGTKLKSRTGDAMTADEAISRISDELAARGTTPLGTVRQVAWNILAWNFLHAARGTNLKFEVEKWVRTDAPGMYITYTLARLWSALDEVMEWDSWWTELSPEDVRLLGIAGQYVYYHQKAVELLDPCPLANFTLDLAKALTQAYEREPIRDGRPIFYRVAQQATHVLSQSMRRLTMFPLKKV